ncbi:hypothetical protein Hypma_002435 [Hypsizygus marmoreus]|uniref:Uncharacterized protein n=1 Tax=Hypsizygus marmoreus TaxID=39966 RepID=A0A369J803_HYPMA|nr:hypothetical protein Hypma_002435 [Hypsizygus marmoreus]
MWAFLFHPSPLHQISSTVSSRKAGNEVPLKQRWMALTSPLTKIPAAAILLPPPASPSSPCKCSGKNKHRSSTWMAITSSSTKAAHTYYHSASPTPYPAPCDVRTI